MVHELRAKRRRPGHPDQPRRTTADQPCDVGSNHHRAADHNRAPTSTHLRASSHLDSGAGVDHGADSSADHLSADLRPPNHRLAATHDRTADLASADLATADLATADLAAAATLHRGADSPAADHDRPYAETSSPADR
ncbi:hypothetical protein BH23ACT2_BH23ACT2_14650 [soil metagenome]